MVVPVDEDTPAADVAELVERVGDTVTSSIEQTIRVAGTAVGDAFATRTARRVDRIELEGVDSAGPALILPLRAADTVAGVVVVARHNGSRPFSDEQLDIMAAFADQATLAWQLATTQRRMRELDVLTERDRIARDLHDHVIQRLFAVGLGLQGTIPRARYLDVRQRLSQAVDDLQAVISEIRTAIFDLHGESPGITPLRQRLTDAVSQFADSGLYTTVQYIGPLSVVDGILADHAEAVVREAVSNAVRHAHATTLTVRVKVEDELCIEVIDNGCGMPENITASGLTNLRRRAEQASGAFTLEAHRAAVPCCDGRCHW
ncbi:histidine kinase [Mycobacterium heckeshornense]|nr:histidine kinase [Mycobacterium heckeshornense]